MTATMAVSDALVCTECGAFKMQTTDGYGVLCPNGHGRVQLGWKDSYKAQAKIRDLLPWLRKYPFANKIGPVYRLAGKSGVFKKLGKVADHEQPEEGHAGGRIDDAVYEFVKVCEEGYEPLSKYRGTIKDSWLGNCYPEDDEMVSDGRIWIDTAAIGTAEAELIRGFGRGAHGIPEPIREEIIRAGREVELLGCKETDSQRTLFVRDGERVLTFNAAFAAYLRRVLKPDAYALTDITHKGVSVAMLQFMKKGDRYLEVVGAVCEFRNPAKAT